MKMLSWQKIIVTLNKEGKMKMTDISKITDITWAHTVKSVNELEYEHLIKTKKNGRERIIELTKKGQKMAECFGELSGYTKKMVRSIGFNR